MRRHHSGQDGMTLIEVLVAATILVLGIGTAVTALNGSRRLTLKTERKEQALSYAQADAESFRSLKYGDIGTLTPPTSGPASDPATLVITLNGQQVLRVKPLDALVTGNRYQRLAGPGVVPQTESITIGNTKGTVERIVTYEETCALNTVCTGSPTAKRVTVRVQLNPANNVTPAPVVAQTIIADPAAF